MELNPGLATVKRNPIFYINVSVRVRFWFTGKQFNLSLFQLPKSAGHKKRKPLHD